MIKLSLIIPFYNVEKYIEECIRSIYNQDIPVEEYEVICVNDCSPDNSVDIVKKLQIEYKNLILVEHKENKRLGGARNTGVLHSRGKYIWFVDSDDMIMPNCLGSILGSLELYELDFLQFSLNEYRDNHILECSKLHASNVVSGSDLFFDKRYLWWKDHITAWSKVYKKNFLIENNISFAENIMFEDNDYSIKVYSNAQRCMLLSENYYIYRYNNDSITHTRCTSKHIDYWIKLTYRLIELKNLYKKKDFDKRFVNLLDEFVKNLILKILSLYQNIEQREKEKIKQQCLNLISLDKISYIGFKQYVKYKFKLLHR